MDENISRTSGAGRVASEAAGTRISVASKCCSREERPGSDPRYGTLASLAAPITAPVRKSCSRITAAWW
eukprot:scaffold249325_cov30-Tisochrysis_lutea.AAC.9